MKRFRNLGALLAALCLLISTAGAAWAEAAETPSDLLPQDAAATEEALSVGEIVYLGSWPYFANGNAQDMPIAWKVIEKRGEHDYLLLSACVIDYAPAISFSYSKECMSETEKMQQYERLKMWNGYITNRTGQQSVGDSDKSETYTLSAWMEAFNEKAFSSEERAILIDSPDEQTSPAFLMKKTAVQNLDPDVLACTSTPYASASDWWVLPAMITADQSKEADSNYPGFHNFRNVVSLTGNLSAALWEYEKLVEGNKVTGGRLVVEYRAVAHGIRPAVWVRFP